MKDFYEDMPTGKISPSLPEGKVQFGEKWVTSSPIQLPNHEASCFIRGKFDTVVAFSDGSYGVIDFKTSRPKPEHIAFYSRQLHAYAYSLEHPKPGAFSLAPITRLGLLVVEPVDMDSAPEDRVAYLGDVTWQDVPLDMDGFLGFLDGVMNVLEAPLAPPPGPSCGYCKYRDAARSTGF